MAGCSSGVVSGGETYSTTVSASRVTVSSSTISAFSYSYQPPSVPADSGRSPRCWPPATYSRPSPAGARTSSGERSAASIATWIPPKVLVGSVGRIGCGRRQVRDADGDRRVGHVAPDVGGHTDRAARLKRTSPVNGTEFPLGWLGSGGVPYLDEDGRWVTPRDVGTQAQEMRGDIRNVRDEYLSTERLLLAADDEAGVDVNGAVLSDEDTRFVGIAVGGPAHEWV